MANINIYSASAGSGKTYTLARQVIDLLIADPRSYAHILAVTFTNKATGEMKERIVGDLDIMANGADNDPAREALLATHLAMSQARGGACTTREGVIERSKSALRNILLDYGQFSVSTIDSFVQRVIRSFAYEQGLPSNYGVQLETGPVIEGAVDELMESLAINDNLRKLVVEMTEEAIDDDKHWGQAEKKIAELGKVLISEDNSIDLKTLSADNINLLRKAMEDKALNAAKDIISLASGVQSLYSSCGIVGVRSNYTKIDFAKSAMPTFDFKTYDGKRQAIDWALKIGVDLATINIPHLITSKTKGQVDVFRDGLTQASADVANFLAPIRTAESVLKNMAVLGVMEHLARFIGDVSEENNKINMGSSGKLLSDLIDSCPVPFIYEKVGVRYDTIMIDEFQDTSHTQYDNFHPLLHESLDEGHDCLIVGDVKQSIYRFRGGDWQLLGNQVTADFTNEAKRINLTDNYRSKSQIVNFNNALFEILPGVMDRALYSGGLTSADGSTSLLSTMFAGAKQTPKKGDNGLARLTIVTTEGDADTDAAKLYTENAYVDDIKTALDLGYSYSDICILVRKASEAQVVIERLGRETWNGQPIPIMSEDSLFVMSSDATMCIADVMRYLSTGERDALFSALKTLRGLTTEQLGQEFAQTKDMASAELEELRGLGILEMMGAIVNMLPKKLKEDDAIYIDAFQQNVMDAIKDGDSDLSTFLRLIEDNAERWTVMAASSRPAVRLMTIHKSKGLEFRIVIIPNADWTLEAFAGRNTIWCPADRLNIDSWRGGRLPLTYDNNLAGGDFAPDYVAEREQIYADNINMAYVAFTRPKDALMAYGVYQKPKDDKKKKSGDTESTGKIGKYLSAALDEMAAAGDPHISSRNEVVDDDGIVTATATHNITITEYTDGSLSQQITQTAASPGIKQLNVEVPITTDPVGRFKINAEAESRIIEDSADEAGSHRALMISNGLTNHGILENVDTLADLHSAISHAVVRGTLSEADADVRESEMRTRITSDPVVAEWFDGEKVAKVWTETSMVGPAAAPSSGMPFVKRRPDRVMRMNDGRTVLVDYKFGKRNPRHHTQVKEYVEWLKYAGFENIEAYLWYYAEGSVERVAL